MKRLFLRVFPLIVGLAVGYKVWDLMLILTNFGDFFVVLAGGLVIAYVQTRCNIAALKLEISGESADQVDQRRSSLSKGVARRAEHGRALSIGATFALASAVAGNVGPLMVAVLVWFVLIWIADDILVKAAERDFVAVSVGGRQTEAPLSSQARSAESLFRAIDEQRKHDPLVGAKLGAKELNAVLLEGFKSTKGVHVESVLCALGALAGYACQANLREQAKMRGMPEDAPFTVVEGGNGSRYFFGDPLNGALVESTHSVWRIAAAAAADDGSEGFPELEPIFKHVAATVGGDAFGLPRWPSGHSASDTPLNYLKALWPRALAIARAFCAHPSEWPALFGIALQDLIGQSKSVISPNLALTIAMESAIPMSKVDLPQ